MSVWLRAEKNAAMALRQGLISGILTKDELRAIREGDPQLAEILAHVVGVDVQNLTKHDISLAAKLSSPELAIDLAVGNDITAYAVRDENDTWQAFRSLDELESYVKRNSK